MKMTSQEIAEVIAAMAAADFGPEIEIEIVEEGEGV